MLVKLLPDQIAKHWPLVKQALEGSVPGEYLHKYARLNNILENLLAERMHCWWSAEEINGEIKLYGVLVTTFFDDDCARIKSLRLYAVYGYEDVPEQEWIDGLATLERFAKAHGCVQIDAFTEIPYMVALATRLGWDGRFTYLTKEVR
jgi:hypothetical protein